MPRYASSRSYPPADPRSDGPHWWRALRRLLQWFRTWSPHDPAAAPPAIFIPEVGPALYASLAHERHLLRDVPALWTALRAQGVVTVHAIYDGDNDEGRFDTLNYGLDGGRSLDLAATDPALHRQVERLLRDLVGWRHPNWTRDGGSQGRLNWSLVDQRLLHQHYEYVITVVPSRYSGFRTVYLPDEGVAGNSQNN